VNPAKRQKVLLGVLGGLLLIMAWRYLKPVLGGGGDPGVTASAPVPYDPDTVDASGAARPRPRARRGGEPEEDPERVAELRLADLQRVPPGYRPGRDPWRFVDPPPPPPEPPPPPPPGPTPEQLRAMEEARLRAEEQARLAAEQRAIEERKPKPPEFTLDYLGNIGSRNRRIAVFTDGKREYIAQEGQVLEGKFIVARIGYESVDIKYVNFPDEPAKRLAVQPRRR
jgi:hypothetical protein